MNTKKESEYRTNIILKEGKKRKKLRWWYFAIVAVVAAAAIIIALRPSPDPVPEPDIETQLDFKWVSIQAGEFLMGDNFGEGDVDEIPVHPVYLDRYDISKYEVTFEQYDLFCEKTGRSKPSDNNWGRGKRPVINVSWNDADDFCKWLSSETGKSFALPTEAQWERAARDNDQRRYPWGNDPPDCSRANYGDCPPSTTVEVGLFPDGQASGGIHDMAGNVWEWCKDPFSPTYYSISPKDNPQGPASGTSNVLRGGSYSSSTKNIRSSERYNRAPSSTETYIGFRICRNY